MSRGMPTGLLGRYLSLQDAGAIGEDVAVVPALHSTKTVRRLEFGPAGFTALTMGVQAEGSWNRSRLASSGRETSSANSWTDASRVRIRARTPTATPVATLINIETPLRCGHPWIIPHGPEMHTQCR